MVDRDVFEITDFTTASDWERFVAGLEEVLHEWRLPNLKRGRPLSEGDLDNGKWKVCSQEVNFADFKFKIERHWVLIPEGSEIPSSSETDDDDDIPEALHDMMSLENDFRCRNTHSLTQWFGLRDFILISPAVGSETIANESRSKLLLSSVCMALNNTDCRVPAFIQMHHRDEQLFTGVCESGASGVGCHFQMVHQRKHKQPYYDRLASILDLFKSKLGCPYNRIPPVTVSVCFTYVLTDWDNLSCWPQLAPEVDFGFPSLGDGGLNKLPFGSYADPINEILVNAIWPRLTEDVAVDNNVYSDLDPIHAPLWIVRVRVTDDPTCLLGETLMECIRWCNRRETVAQLLGVKSFGITDSETDPGIAHALDRLSGRMLVPNVPSSVSTAVIKTKRQLQQQAGNNCNGPIPESKLKDILYHLFPDALGKTFETGVVRSDDSDDRVELSNLEVIYEGFKLCPTNSLLYSLSIVICHVQRVYGGISAIAHLWHELILELRHRWEYSIPIHGLEPGIPNLSRCLLYQKLQMLNYCIDKKRVREQAQPRKGPSDQSSLGKLCSSSEDDDDDEFYECSSEPSPSKSVSSHAPDGRLRQCNDWFLVDSNEPLYIPITQEPSPMTEDQLEEHAAVLIQLGDDEDGAQMRAEMQSACLLSDMQAFKAANPGCLLEDFVRWYSPRDWIADVGDTGEKYSDSDNDERLKRKGHLSSRMLIPGNVWLDAWNRSKPIPVRRQKRLFDDTKEGEKVLHYLSSLKPAEVLLKLMPIIIHNAIITIYKNRNSLVPFVETALESVAKDARNLSKLSSTTVAQYKELVEMLSSLEVSLSRVKALQNLFADDVTLPPSQIQVDNFVRRLLDNKFQVELHGGSKTPIGQSLLKLFQKSAQMNSGIEDLISADEVDSNLRFPINPERRDYLLRCSVSRPAPYSTPTPQRLLCSASINGDFRLMAAFSRDTTFQ